MPRSLWLGCSSLADSMPSLRCLYNPGTGALPAFQVLSVSPHSFFSFHLCMCTLPSLLSCFTFVYSASYSMLLLHHSNLWYLNSSYADSGQFSAGVFPLPQYYAIILSELTWHHHLFCWLLIVSKIHHLIIFGKWDPSHSLQSGYSCRDFPPILSFLYATWRTEGVGSLPWWYLLPAFVCFKFVSSSLDILTTENYCTSKLSIKRQIKENCYFSLVSEFGRFRLFSHHETVWCWRGLFGCFVWPVNLKMQTLFWGWRMVANE